jgi:hypothetical protein
MIPDDDPRTQIRRKIIYKKIFVCLSSMVYAIKYTLTVGRLLKMSIILLKTSCCVLTVHVETFMSPHSRKRIKGNVISYKK